MITRKKRQVRGKGDTFKTQIINIKKCTTARAIKYRVIQSEMSHFCAEIDLYVIKDIKNPQKEKLREIQFCKL